MGGGFCTCSKPILFFFAWLVAVRPWSALRQQGSSHYEESLRHTCPLASSRCEGRRRRNRKGRQKGEKRQHAAATSSDADCAIDSCASMIHLCTHALLLYPVLRTVFSLVLCSVIFNALMLYPPVAEAPRLLPSPSPSRSLRMPAQRVGFRTWHLLAPNTNTPTRTYTRRVRQTGTPTRHDS